jgi:DNA-binding NarL/FixJ family response regulator
MIRVFLVDDHAVMREGLRAVLGGNSNLEVVGEAANGRELLDQLATTPTDVVMLDMNMPVLDGLSTISLLREQFPEVRILMLSMLGHERIIGQVLDAGADGYVLKSTDKGELVAGIQAVALGKQYLCSEIGLAMLRKVLTLGDTAPGEPKLTTGGLSFREREVLTLIAEGLTSAEIADKLFTSKRTIETHRQNIIEKTQAKNTAALINYAVRNGLVK